MRPRVGERKCVRRLKQVVLPAPFGPMRAWMLPRRTRRLTSLTATKPRNSLVSPSVSRMSSAAMAGTMIGDAARQSKASGPDEARAGVRRRVRRALLVDAGGLQGERVGRPRHGQHGHVVAPQAHVDLFGRAVS